MEQTNLFENREPLARAEDPATSQRAATELTESGRRNSQKWQLLNWMRDWVTNEFDAMTSAEIAKASGIWHPTVHKRLPDLLRDGHVKKWYPRTCTITHNECITWYALPR